ncbi:MAG: hypothetical protein Kow00106_11840 [Anaerolineae bacterium]
MTITRFIVRGHSMRPTFRQGDVLALAPAPPESIRRGQVIVFRAPDRDPADWVMHRVIRVTGSGAARQIVTRGDNAPRSDGIVPPEWIVGRVIGRCRGERVIPLRRAEEVFWLFAARPVRRLRVWRYRLLSRLIPALLALGLARLLRVRRVRLGERELTLLWGRVIAVRQHTPEGVRGWVHPFFRGREM